MSYREKGEWVRLVVIGVTFGAYVAVVLGRTGTTPVSEVPYVSAMLWSIGLGIVLSIISHVAVVAVTTRPHDCTTDMTDVRDRDINRLGEHVAGVVLAVGMVTPLGLAMAEVEHFWITNAMYAAFVVSTLVGAGVKLVAYRRGL